MREDIVSPIESVEASLKEFDSFLKVAHLACNRFVANCVKKTIQVLCDLDLFFDFGIEHEAIYDYNTFSRRQRGEIKKLDI